MLERFTTMALLRVRGVFAAGVFMLALSLIGVVLGWILVGSVTRDFRASIEVSRSALSSIGDTLELVEDVAKGTGSSIDAAAQSASSAADTTRNAAASLGTLADFLDSELPQNIEAIQRALPGAINAADAVDTTLGALSFLGIDYSPDEPFGESLRRVQGAVAVLPDEIRAQSQSIRGLIPSAAELAGNTDDLALALSELNEGLGGIDEITAAYEGTVGDAEVAIEQADSSLNSTTLLLRSMLVIVALGGAIAGFALILIDRALAGAIGQGENVG